MKFKKWDLSPFQKTKISNQTPRFYCAKDKLPMNSLNQKYPFLRVIISLLLMLVLHPPTNPMQCNAIEVGSTKRPCASMAAHSVPAWPSTASRQAKRARSPVHGMDEGRALSHTWISWCGVIVKQRSGRSDALSLSLSLCVSLLTLCVLWIRLLLGMF